MFKLDDVEKINPIGGCLPLFLQLPIFLDEMFGGIQAEAVHSNIRKPIPGHVFHPLGDVGVGVVQVRHVVAEEAVIE